MKKVYFISGLGADKRMFQYLDLSFYEPVFIDWIIPFPKESLEKYALRLREKIAEEHPIIVGLSFGGMLATEMAKHDSNIKAIIISSNKTYKEFPKYLRIGQYFALHTWVSNRFIKKHPDLFLWIQEAKTAKSKKVLYGLFEDSDFNFIKWAMTAILHWKNETIPPNVIYIHGTADKLLPYKYVKADYTIKHGTHAMIMDEASEISTLLKRLI